MPPLSIFTVERTPRTCRKTLQLCGCCPLQAGWECQACTYVNAEDRDICDICAKSRRKGPEVQPLLRGGKECSKCTLVNQPEAVYCSACASSLDDAPTYI